MSNHEELIKLLEEETNAKKFVTPKRKTKYAYSVEAFIKKFKIKPGPFKVPTHVIYYLYSKYITINNNYIRCKKEEFFRTFKKHFEQIRTGRQRYYLINDGLELSNTIYEKAEKHKRSYQGSKKIKSKIQDEISRDNKEEESSF